MPVQDLTPQLRTRLSRVERVVGWFVMLATLLLLWGFSYYVYHTAERKGWFKVKIAYHTYVADATGLGPGNKVKLMGFDVGEITRVEGMAAGKTWEASQRMNVFVQFYIMEPYFGYIWTDSQVRVGTGDFLGHRLFEVTKGESGDPTFQPGKPLRVLNKRYPIDTNLDYVTLEQQPEGPWLRSVESPPLNLRMEQIANRVEEALPSILQLTNQLQTVLSNSARLTADLATGVAEARPILTNLLVISTQLTNGNGALGEWFLPTNLNAQLERALATADSTLKATETNVVLLATNLNRTLENVANITSNLNVQVQTNDKIVSQVSGAIIHADELVQGFKRHWMLRSAFKEKPTNRSFFRRPAAPPRVGK
jgi:ABC-type transporter Mla subunit MlaD